MVFGGFWWFLGEFLVVFGGFSMVLNSHLACNQLGEKDRTHCGQVLPHPQQGEQSLERVSISAEGPEYGQRDRRDKRRAIQDFSLIIQLFGGGHSPPPPKRKKVTPAPAEQR